MTTTTGSRRFGRWFYCVRSARLGTFQSCRHVRRDAAVGIGDEDPRKLSRRRVPVPRIYRSTFSTQRPADKPNSETASSRKQSARNRVDYHDVPRRCGRVAARERSTRPRVSVNPLHRPPRAVRVRRTTGEYPIRPVDV